MIGSRIYSGPGIVIRLFLFYMAGDKWFLPPLYTSKPSVRQVRKNQLGQVFIDTPAQTSYTAFSGQRNNTIQDLIGRN